MRAFFITLGFTCVACSSFQSTDPGTSSGSPGGEDAGTDAPPGMVTGAPDIGISIAVGDSKVTSYITRGSALALPVTLTRKASSTGAVDITVTGLPAGVTAEPLTVPAGALTATLTLDASSASVPGTTAMTQVLAHEETSGVNDIAIFSTFVRGTPGSPDLTFGSGGTLLAGGHGFSTTLVLHDDSILAAHHVTNDDVISRFTPAGALDTTFGGAGTGTLAVSFTGSGGATLQMSAVEGATPAAGFIYVIEFSPPSTETLYRFHMDGTPDTGFSPSGSVVLDDGDTTGGGASVLALADGTALVSWAHTSANLITHWKADGTRDLAYGVSGSCPNGGAMVQKASGQILTLGRTNATDHSTPLRGCTVAGLPDPAVGTAPDYTVLLNNANSMVLTDTQGLLVLSNTGMSYSRFSPTFVEDGSIGNNGDVEVPGGASVILAQPGGGVLVANNSVVAFKPDGSLNTAFGTGGTASFPVDDGQDHGIQQLVAYPDGRAIAVSGDGIDNSAVYQRFWQ